MVIPAIPLLPLRLGRGTDGGLVVHLRAAKYKQSAGPGQECEVVQYRDTPIYAFRVGLPVIIRSPSALLSSSVLTNLSTFAWVREDLRYEWKQSWTNSSDRRSGVVVAVMDQEVNWGVQRSGVALECCRSGRMQNKEHRISGFTVAAGPRPIKAMVELRHGERWRWKSSPRKS